MYTHVALAVFPKRIAYRRCPNKSPYRDDSIEHPRHATLLGGHFVNLDQMILVMIYIKLREYGHIQLLEFGIH